MQPRRTQRRHDLVCYYRLTKSRASPLVVVVFPGLLKIIISTLDAFIASKKSYQATIDTPATFSVGIPPLPATPVDHPNKTAPLIADTVTAANLAAGQAAHLLALGGTLDYSHKVEVAD